MYSEICIEAISNYIKANNLSNSAFAKLIEIDAGQLKKIMDNHPKNFFTVPQLLRVSSVLQMSIDDLLGNKPVKQKEESLSDVLRILIDLNDIAPFEILENKDSNEINLKFKATAISEMLKEWNEVQNINSSIKQKLTKIWENDFIEKNSDKTRKTDYLPKREYGKITARKLYNDYYTTYLCENCDPEKLYQIFAHNIVLTQIQYDCLSIFLENAFYDDDIDNYEEEMIRFIVENKAATILH